MAEENKTPKGDINFEFNQGTTGLNMDSIPSQIDKGSLSYALNAALENFDANSVTYQNEPGNEFCVSFPDNYVLIGKHFIPEQSKHVFFLANQITGDSEIGYMVNNDCVYHTLINAKCLNFDVNFPIQKSVHKTSNCGTELYWAQPNADRRYINLDPTKIPYLTLSGSTPCDPSLVQPNQLDCNQIRMQPSYSIPQITIKDVIIGGNLIAGTYQFATQYSDALGNPLSSYQPITNPTPIADPQFTSVNFNYPVGKAIVVGIDNIDTKGQFGFFNLAVIKTINDITSVELVGTFGIEGPSREIIYSGQNVTQARLTINDIFEKFPFYGPADDVTTVQDVLVWKGLSASERVNYQQIASQITLQWETWRIPPTENYANELNATNLRGYLRDEVYAFEIVFLLRTGKQTDGFHIPGRALTNIELGMPTIPPTNNDYIEDPKLGPLPYWRIYNTALVLGNSPLYKSDDVGYKGPYQYGIFSYWESDQTYPCDKQMWGDLAEQPIRHHKFPDVAISPIIEGKPFTGASNLQMGNDAIFPIGVKVDVEQIKFLIRQSILTPEQKDDIVGFKIVRGNRGTNKSIVAKGILRNVGKYTRDDEDFYYANYPYNDLNADPFLNSTNNAFSNECQSFIVYIFKFNVFPVDGLPYTEIQFTDCNTNKTNSKKYTEIGTFQLCSVTKPIMLGSGFSNIITYLSGDTSGPLFETVFYSNPNTAAIKYANYDIWDVRSINPQIIDACGGWRVSYEDAIEGPKEIWIAGWPDNQDFTIHTKVDSIPTRVSEDVCGVRTDKLSIVRVPACASAEPLPPITSEPNLRYRQIFNSPETSFGQPFLGDVLKLESVIFGKGQAHFVQVKDNAKYRLLTKEAQQDALTSAGNMGNSDAAAVFTAYQAYLEIYINGITRKNYAYSFNSIADYNYTVAVPDNQEMKQRRLDLKKYLIPAIQSVGEGDVDINNYQRETSVYLKTDDAQTALPFPHLSPNMAPTGLIEHSRFIAGCSGGQPCIVPGTTTTTTTISSGFCPGNCATPEDKKDITVISYYASLKNTFRGQWGQIYTYQTIDTGFQYDFDLVTSPPQSTTVFGGDTFICRFAFKTKVPFFIDNRVGAPDDSEIFYDELGNIGYPKFWHSARSILEDFVVPNIGNMTNIISYKAHNFDCPNCQAVPVGDPNRTFYDGYFYLFAYGIPNFYVESSYNVDLRQAFNNKEGDFWPHVTNSIPDDWVQESFVSIQNDNTYYYNVTFSKQNTENVFTHIPANFQFRTCEFIYPFRVIYSDPQIATADTTVNNWLTYRASAYFDFPQNYGALVSIDGLENQHLLARFENKSQLYNALYTNQTNTGGQVYLAQPLFSRLAPPLDFAETDLGYVGSQHKFLLKTPIGQISIDAKRGQVFLLVGNNVKDLSAPGSGMNRFFTDHLAFEILRYFPDVNIDNNFNGVGLHGVYDSKYDRIIITKLDYIPHSKDVKYDSVTKEFYIEEITSQVPISTTTTSSSSSSSTTSSSTTVGPTTSSTSSTSSTTTTIPVAKIRRIISLTDPVYFCNKSWTISYSTITNTWLSFHSYLPNWYMGENNFFYSGTNICCSTFDFNFLVGELIPNPPTTTSTSTTAVPTTSTTSTTTTLSCALIGGTVFLQDCILAGTGVITVLPPLPPCTRPNTVVPFTLMSGYQIIVPPSTVITTFSATVACNGKNAVFLDPANKVPVPVIVYAVNLNIGSTVYANNGTNDCSLAPNGYYFTTVPAGGIYQVNAGKIASISPCAFTTTTTTTTCNMYLYEADIYSCGICTPLGSGTFGNTEALTVGKWYDDNLTDFKLLVTAYNGCGSGLDRTILDSGKKDSCPEVICLTTTTTTTINTGPYFKYSVDIANCTSCATLFVITEVININALIVGKWYYDNVTNLRIHITGIIGTVAELPDVDIDPATEQDTCAAVICP